MFEILLFLSTWFTVHNDFTLALQQGNTVMSHYAIVYAIILFPLEKDNKMSALANGLKINLKTCC